MSSVHLMLLFPLRFSTKHKVQSNTQSCVSSVSVTCMRRTCIVLMRIVVAIKKNKKKGSQVRQGQPRPHSVHVVCQGCRRSWRRSSPTNFASLQTKGNRPEPQQRPDSGGAGTETRTGCARIAREHDADLRPSGRKTRLQNCRGTRPAPRTRTLKSPKSSVPSSAR